MFNDNSTEMRLRIYSFFSRQSEKKYEHNNVISKINIVLEWEVLGVLRVKGQFDHPNFDADI